MILSRLLRRHLVVRRPEEGDDHRTELVLAKLDAAVERFEEKAIRIGELERAKRGQG